MMGAERRSMVMDRGREAQHGLSRVGPRRGRASCCRRPIPVHKVTIIPRGRALGVTMQLPEQDRYAYDRDYMLQRDRDAVRRPHRRRDLHGPDDHRRVQRLRACHADGARHGHPLRHVGDLLGHDGLRGERGRSLPRPLDHDDRRTSRKRPCRRSTRRSAASSTSSTRSARKLIEENRDKVEAMAKALLDWETHRLGADRRHHGRPSAASTARPMPAVARPATGARGAGRRSRPAVDHAAPDGLSAVLTRGGMAAPFRSASGAAIELDHLIAECSRARRGRVLPLRTIQLSLGRPLVMGVAQRHRPIRFPTAAATSIPTRRRWRTRDMVADGADIIDIGAESTRPGAAAGARGRGARTRAAAGSAALAALNVPLSVDTRKPA